MVVRLRIYNSENAHHEEADEIFYDYVKPVHQRHGAVFKGRYRDKKGKIIVMWQYESEEDLKRIQQSVAEDPETIRNREIRLTKGLHGVSFDEMILKSTGE